MILKYFNPYGGNFGDQLGVEIINRMLGYEVSAIDLRKEKKRNKSGIIALGSIFHFAIDGDIIWGTGVNPNWQKNKQYTNLDIRAVRGPLTRKYIQDFLGQPCPEIYGDPGLLIKILFPELERMPIRNYGIVPHYWDMNIVKDNPNTFMPTNNWDEVVKFILGCELVITSSLHAIIVAEAFGIPARWWHSSDLKSAKTEGTFKYNDYYASTHRSQDDYAVSINDAILTGGKEPIENFDYASLLSSFPIKEFT